MLSNDQSLKVNRLMEVGRYNEAMEIIYDEYSRDGNWLSLYETFSSCRRDYYPSLNLPQAKQREMYRNICKGESCESWSCPFHRSRGEENQIRFAEEIVKEGLVDEAIAGLKKHCDKDEAKKSHLKLGELYEKKGDFKAAVGFYMNFNLVDRAATCYQHTGDIDKAALYLLGEGKASEGVRLYDRAERPERAEWFQKLTKFDLVAFNHPIRSLAGLVPEKRVEILKRVGDKFNAKLEELRLKTEIARSKGTTTLDKEMRQDMGIRKGENELAQKGYMSHLDYKPFILLDSEVLTLARFAGDSSLEREAGQRLHEMKKHAAALEGKLYQFNPMMAYVASGQFCKAIIVGEGWVVNRGEEEKGRGKNLMAEISVVAHSYEMIGAFSEAASWISRLLSEWEKDSDRIGKSQGLAQCHRWMSRVYLKMGQFTKAAASFLQYSIQQDGGSKHYILSDRIQNYVLAGELYLWGRDLEGWRRVVKHVVEWSPSYYGEQLPIFAKAAEDNGFYDEAAKIWDEVGGKSDVKKITLTTKVQESSQEGADHNVDETPMLICSCGEVLQPHWKLCPSCGKSVELACPCGEPLKAGWKLCPACGKKISE